MIRRNNEPKVIAITGGPCGGKTTLLARAHQRLNDLGWRVVTVSEAATDLIAAGIRPGDIPDSQFQYHLLQAILEKEDRMKAAAQALANEGHKVVVLCDRGAMDARAYMNSFEFDGMVGRLGLSPVDLSDRRYDAVIVMQSVAVDKPELFTCENNAARSEDAQEAAFLDRDTREAWVGHPHLVVVGNEGDLEAKLTRAFAAICHTIAIPAPLEIERKYLLDPSYRGLPPFPGKTVAAEIEQYYLANSNPDIEERIRSWSRERGTVYYHTYKEKVRPGVRIERERQIEEREFFTLLRRADPACGKITKWRHCFVWEGQYFQLDSTYQVGRVYLEVETTEEGAEVILPPGYAEIFHDVTGQEQHSNRAIAKELGARA